MQPKIGRFYLYIKKDFTDLFESCRPSFFPARYNEQMVFLVFMYRKKYNLINDGSAASEGDKYRRYMVVNACITVAFFVLTIVIFAIGWSGNL